jgi:hypothetical protein
MTAPAEKVQLGRIGESVRRADAIPKATGEFAYSSDLHAAGMLWGHTVRSPHAHALVRSIDVSRAVRMPGVHAVLTHEDVPGKKLYGLEFQDQPVLAIDRVRYFGEPVALVAAEHPEQARRAAEEVRVEYEPLEPVVDPERATEQEPLHPDRPTMGHGYRDDSRPNVVRSLVISHGDPEAQGDVSVSGVYEIGIQDQAFLGPESGLAVPDGEGGVDVYVATQWLHVDRDIGARIRVTVNNAHRAEHVRARIVQVVGVRMRLAVGMQRLRLGRTPRVGDRDERLVVDDDQLRGAARLLRMLGGDERDRLAEVADAVDRKNRLIEELEPVRLASGHVGVGEDRVHARDRERAREVDRPHARVRVRAAQRVAPEHSRGLKVARVLELPRRLGNPVGAGDALADPADLDVPSGQDPRGAHARSAASRTASKIFP